MIGLIDVITIGDAMITFDPSVSGPLRFVDSFKKKVGGAELNIAIGCARLGLQTTFLSRIGDDEFGRFIYNFLRGEGIDVSEVKLVKDHPTSLNFKELREGGFSETYYYRYKSPTLTLTPSSLNEDVFRKSRLLHISGVFPSINSRNIGIIDAAIQLAKKHKLKISLDPNIRLKLWSEKKAKDTLLRWLPEVDYLLAGIDEAELLFGTQDVDQIIYNAKRYAISHLFIKLGEKGAKLWTNEQLYTCDSIHTTKVVDVVGAGDGFGAGAIYGLLHDWEPEKVLKFANTIGAMVVEVYGDNEGLPYLDEAISRFENRKKIDR
ncbi:sugar kinase [Pseudogracilibacillus auburnensis]|nr:sugar kinase [Pseudogracilibacillus auburnensis]